MAKSIIKCLPDPEYYLAEGCWINELLNTSENPVISLAKVRVEPGEKTVLDHLHKTI